jgi:hypothetical protein
MLTSSAAFPRAGGHVQAVQCAVARLLALRGSAEGTPSRGRRHALACPGSAPGALWRGMDVCWAPLGARVLTSLVPGFVGAVAGQHQGSERVPVDMVMQARIDQVRGWHEVAMPCHGMARFLLIDHSFDQCKWW